MSGNLFFVTNVIKEGTQILHDISTRFQINLTLLRQKQKNSFLRTNVHTFVWQYKFGPHTKIGFCKKLLPYFNRLTNNSKALTLEQIYEQFKLPL